MPETLTKTIPFLVKLIAVLIGGVISLVLSGDIYLNEKRQLVIHSVLNVVIKLACSIGLGLYIGEFFVDYYDFEHLRYYSQAVFHLVASLFGMLIIGIVYRSIQLTFTDKTLGEIVTEVKEIVKAFLK